MGGLLTVFELVGLPGAGKTTLARGLLSRLAAEGRACGERDLAERRGISRANHLSRVAKFTLARGRHFPAALRLAAAVKPPTVARMRLAGKLAVWPYRLAVARAQGNEVVVLDQGVLQSAWSVLLEGSLRREHLLREAIEEVLAGCDATFAFISVELDVVRAAARIHARDAMYAPFNRSEEETLQLLSRHAEQLDRVVAAGLRATGAPHLRLDGSNPLAESAARVDAFVDSVLGSAVGR